jgi:hypothetical protein
LRYVYQTVRIRTDFESFSLSYYVDKNIFWSLIRFVGRALNFLKFELKNKICNLFYVVEQFTNFLKLNFGISAPTIERFDFSIRCLAKRFTRSTKRKVSPIISTFIRAELVSELRLLTTRFDAFRFCYNRSFGFTSDAKDEDHLTGRAVICKIKRSSEFVYFAGRF